MPTFKPTIIIDSREQLPLTFSDAVHTDVATIELGDYTVRGLETHIAIERKSLNDLVGSSTTGRDRFKRELKALRHMRFAALVIEADWQDIFDGQYRSRAHPNSIIGSLMSFAINYGVFPIMAHDHASASILVERMLIVYAKGVEQAYKSLTKGGASHGV